MAAEARLGLRPWRRIDLLRQRIQAFEQQVALTRQRRALQEQELQQAQDRLAGAERQKQTRQQQLEGLEQTCQAQQRLERPTSQLAQARQRLQAAGKRCQSRRQAWQNAQRRLDKTTTRLSQQLGELAHLYQRLIRFEQENVANAQPVEAEFRLDAGFGTYENIALLIEMGYEVYTKPHSHHVVTYLKKQVNEQTDWTRVGANAELVAWPNLSLKNGPIL